MRDHFRLVLSLLAIFLPCQIVRPAPVEQKRRNPEVLAPVEFQSDVARVCVHTYMIVKERDAVRIGLIEKTVAGKAVVFVKKDELKHITAPEFARDILPLHVAVITASFPFRKQVEAFQEALRLHSVGDLRDEAGAFPSFRGFRVERRQVSPKKTDWKPLDLESAESPFVGVIARTMKEIEPEPEEVKAVKVPGLALPLPVLAHGRYPECQLPLLRKTRADPRARVLPDYCLLRFLDFDVELGRSYEYRLRVRMANPNYGKKSRVEKESFAEPKELLGPWARVPGTVALDPDIRYYAVDAKALDPKYPGPAAGRDEVALQVQRWMAMYELGGRTFFPVGCWVVAERVLVSRGARVGIRRQLIRLPVWVPEEGRYVEAGRPGAGGVIIDFSPNNTPNQAPLLLDFEGGKRSYRGVAAESPTEVLLLSPDGRLLGLNGRRDAADPARKARHEDWKEWLNSGKPPH